MAVMEKITAGISSIIRKGSILRKTPERLLQARYLTDKAGTIWAIGFRSGAWHFYRDRKWMKSPAAPDPASLPGPDELKAIDDDVRMALLFLFASDEPLPEKAAAPWDPPADIPERPLFCGWCFGVNPADSAFCRLCGAPGDKLVNDPDMLPRKIEPPETSGQPCPKCGRANDAEACFCEQCGVRIGKRPPAKNFCSSCGQKSKPGTFSAADAEKRSFDLPAGNYFVFRLAAARALFSLTRNLTIRAINPYGIGVPSGNSRCLWTSHTGRAPS